MHMWILRDIEPRLQRSARTRPVVVVTGARQTGRTHTFLRLFPKYGFVSLDLPTEAEQAEKEPLNFLRRHTSPMIIDEDQYAPGMPPPTFLTANFQLLSSARRLVYA
jgi:uncharacterized protein